MSAALEFDRVTLARGARVVLTDFSGAVRAGEFVGVFGPNGAGKTTLLHAILGLLPLRSGELRVLGRTPGRGNPNAGYLPQQRAPIADLRLRARDFVAAALRGERWGVALRSRESAAEVERVLRLVEAGAMAERPLCELSGGERQRLLLAQALLGKPRLLLLDEPLVSLDPHFQQEAVALVKRIQQSTSATVLFTAHELNPLLGAMDRVLYLGHAHGALGAVDEVVDGAVLSRLYGTPIEVVRVGGRVVVVAGHGEIEAEAHRHDA